MEKGWKNMKSHSDSAKNVWTAASNMMVSTCNKKCDICGRTEFKNKASYAGHRSWCKNGGKCKSSFSEKWKREDFRNLMRMKREVREENRISNHKVVDVRNVGELNTYDLTVDEFHNFALDCGIFVSNCPHCPIGILISGSPDVYANGIPHSRLGDQVNEICGSGTVVTASSDVFANG
jgi:hypothetical protein